VHRPLEQTSGGVQTRPQLPQLCASLASSTQTLPHRVNPPAQGLPPLPPLG